MRNTVIAFILVAGCTAASHTDTSDQIDAPVGKADAASKPSGSYTNATPHFGELSTLTLNDDFTFERSAIVACAGGGTCAPLVQTGSYLFTHSSTKHYLRFYSDTEGELDRYQWRLSGGQLELALDTEGDDNWFQMDQGGSCDTAGGTCVALAPDSCQFGTVGDATQYSCGSGLGVECCLPPQPDNSCSTAADCSGLLPQFCRMCAGGGESCAHWSCVANACQIATCD